MLAQFKVLLNCAASLDPEGNMNGSEDFLTTVLPAHIVATAKKMLSEKSIDNVKDLGKEILQQLFTLIPTKIARADKVHLYASLLMTLLCILACFQ